MAEIKTAQEIATSQYVFGILFIVLLFIVYKALAKYINEMKQENVRREEELKQLYSDHKEESKQREQTLLNHLEKSNDTQLKTSRTLEKIQASLHSLEERTDQGFKEVWQKLQKIDN